MPSLSLEQVYKEYHSKVTGFVMKKVGDYNVVEDLVSDIFLKISQNFDRYDESKGAVSTWVYTISNRCVTDYYRTRRVFEVLPDDNGSEGELPDALIDSSQLDHDLLLNEQLNQLADALLQLKEKERDIIILHYYKDVNLNKVAELLGMSYANAKVVHKKALSKLNSLMNRF